MKIIYKITLPLFLFLGLTRHAHALGAQDVLGDAMVFVGSVLSWIAGIGIAIEGWLISVLVRLNTDIINSQVVENGFPITLALANLALVVFIVVIAVATMFRSQRYGMKQALPRLITVAIAINFGLTIAGGLIIAPADGVGLYFLNQATPSGGDFGIGFASAIGGAFQPQRFFLQDLDNLEPRDVESLKETFTAERNAGYLSSFLAPFIGIIMTVIILFLIIVTLGALIVMLGIRYVQIAFLLVTLPLAWAAFVFPGLQHYTKQWWNKLIKQAFFFPIVIFFVWLAVATADAMKESHVLGSTPLASFTSSIDIPAFAAISSFFGSLVVQVFEPFFNAMIIAMIMIAGLVTAHGMGIKFADAAMAGVGGARGWALGALGRGTKRVGTAPIRRTQEQIADWASKRRTGTFAGIRRVSAGLVGAGALRLAGVGGKDQLGYYQKAVVKRSDEENVARLRVGWPLTPEPERVAIYDHLAKKRELDDEVTVNSLTENPEATKKLFMNYGASDEFKRVNKAVGGIEVQKATKEYSEAQEKGVAGDELDELYTKMVRAGDEFMKKIKGADLPNMQLNDIFGEQPKFGMDERTMRNFQYTLQRAMGLNSPQLLGKGLYSKLDPETLQHFDGMIETSFNTAAKENADIADRLVVGDDSVLAKHKSRIGSLTFGYEGPGFEGGSAPSPATE